MSRISPQAQTAIDALKAAGFARSDFRVRTARRRIPGGHEYGRAIVRLNPRSRVNRCPFALARAIRAGFAVTASFDLDGSLKYWWFSHDDGFSAPSSLLWGYCVQDLGNSDVAVASRWQGPSDKRFTPHALDAIQEARNV